MTDVGMFYIWPSSILSRSNKKDDLSGSILAGCEQCRSISPAGNYSIQSTIWWKFREQSWSPKLMVSGTSQRNKATLRKEYHSYLPWSAGISFQELEFFRRITSGHFQHYLKFRSEIMNPIDIMIQHDIRTMI